jgi:glycosyltransferase involved in cell wall biosynthesis
MQEDLVSVIIPCYNAQDYLKEAVFSIMRQTYKNLEIIVIDDCSSDGSWDILIDLKNNDDRIQIYRNSKNLKLISTLNIGVGLANGKYIARMDADDISDIRRIERQMEVLHSDSTVDVVSVFPVMIDSFGKYHSRQKHFICTSSGSARYMALFESPILHAGILAKTEILKNNLYRNQLNCQHIEDYELWVRLLFERNIKFIGIPEPLYSYRINPQSVSYLYTEEQQNNHIRLSLATINSCIHYNISELHLRILLLRLAKLNITSKEFRDSIIELKNMQNIYVAIYKGELTKKDYCEIKNWTQQRIIRICLYFIIKGSIPIKYQTIMILLKEYNSLFHLITYKNILSNIEWLFSNYKIRLQNATK